MQHQHPLYLLWQPHPYKLHDLQATPGNYSWHESCAICVTTKPFKAPSQNCLLAFALPIGLQGSPNPCPADFVSLTKIHAGAEAAVATAVAGLIAPMHIALRGILT